MLPILLVKFCMFSLFEYNNFLSVMIIKSESTLSDPFKLADYCKLFSQETMLNLFLCSYMSVLFLFQVFHCILPLNEYECETKPPVVLRNSLLFWSRKSWFQLVWMWTNMIQLHLIENKYMKYYSFHDLFDSHYRRKYRRNDSSFYKKKTVSRYLYDI